MADRWVVVDVRYLVVTWPKDAPRGAVSAFCREHAVSRSWFYEVRRRALQEPITEAMRPRPRPPAPPLLRTPAEVEEAAVLLRKELAELGVDHGPRTVRAHLMRRGLPAPAVSTLARLFTRRGMVVPQPAKRPRSSFHRFEHDFVHECWQLDAFEWRLADDSRCVVFQLIDDRCRYALASLVADAETSRAAIAVVNKAIAIFQVPNKLLTDNHVSLNPSRRGWVGQLVKHLDALGCRPISGRPRHPQTQGKDERVHQTLQRWLRARPAANTIDELQRLVDDFDEYYNHQRPHQSLHDLTPAEALARGPVAIPPTPHPPTPNGITVRVRISAHTVDHRGRLSVDQHVINLGVAHRDRHVTAITNGTSISIFDDHGELLRSLTTTPGRRYHGNGRPPGRPPRQQ